MSGAEIGLALSVFLACTVEAVEALTIVLAVGSTRSWSSAMSGVGAAALALAVIVAALGPALTSLPIDVLRVLIGGLLLIFGLQWLRKAILRSAGLKAKHDELQIYAGAQAAAARAAGARHDRASMAMPSRSPSKGCCWRASRSHSSCSPLAPTSTESRWRPRPPGSPCSWSSQRAPRQERRWRGCPRTR